MLTQWDKVKAAERMQRFIEANLESPVTMAQLAREARYSQWHAARVFREITGRSPFEYLRLRRLTVAAERLRSSDVRVVDVAFDFVFDSHEGFSRAFAREFGLSPLRFRRSNCPLPEFAPPRLREWYMMRQRGETPMAESSKPVPVFVQVIDRPVRKMIVKRGINATHYFEYCEEVGCDVWEKLGTIAEAIHEPMGLWLPERFRSPGTSTYAQGVEVPQDYCGPVPNGYDLIDLPACQMMVFQGPPFEDNDFEQAISTIWDIIKTYKPENYGFEWADDDGPRFQLAPFGYRGYIEGRPVRRK